MANSEHIKILNLGVKAWNKWRHENDEIRPDFDGANLSGVNLAGEDTLLKTFPDLAVSELVRLSGVKLFDAYLFGTNLSGSNLLYADLSGACLNKANLSKANLRFADLTIANLIQADLSEADLSEANLGGTLLGEADLSRAVFRGAFLIGANLAGSRLTAANLTAANLTAANLTAADLTGADLTGADLAGASLAGANLSKANLAGAELIGTSLVGTNLENADLNGCRIYGISAWNVRTNQKTKQANLIITRRDEATVTVDDLEVAQFIYLLLNRKRLQDVLNTVTSKAVLLLGRFTPERKAVLNALADELRKYNLVPIIFDFERSRTLDFTETIKILAGLSLFVIVDITKPKSAPQELTAVVPDYQIPFVPILEEGEDPYSMFGDFKKYDWVLKPIRKYSTKEMLLENFKNGILEPALKRHKEIQRKKNEEFESMSIEDMVKKKIKSDP